MKRLAAWQFTVSASSQLLATVVRNTMMHRFLIVFVSALSLNGLLLGISTLAHAVSPGIVRAVEDRPVSVQLEAGRTIAGDILSVHATTFVFRGTDDEFYEFAYDEVRSVHVRVAPSLQRRVIPKVPVAAAHRAPDSVSIADQPSAQAQRSYPDVFFRAGLDLGFGDFSVRQEGRNVSRTETVRGLALGGDFALGVRVSERFALHGTYGVRRFYLPQERVKDVILDIVDASSFESTGLKARVMNIGLGFSVLSGNFVMSVSVGGANGKMTSPTGLSSVDEWGLGADAMIGFATRSARLGRVGVALAATLMLAPSDEDDVRWTVYSVGPRLFYAY